MQCRAIWVGLAVVGLASGQGPDNRVALEQFEKEVRPVLARNCLHCHGPVQQASALRLDSREALLAGGKRGPSIRPGSPSTSLLMKAIRHTELKMPVGAKLADSEIAAIERWIAGGAVWPDGAKKSNAAHWAFLPVRASMPPSLEQTVHPVDQFVRAALKTAGLTAAREADRRTLIRRLSLVLTGLPPTPLEVDLFVHDTAAGAYERLVDRTLASRHFGEHWARHWLDVMRFAETFGNDWNYEINGAWHYRDYLIRAFNGDVPYDQLIREHLAGDLLPKPRINTKDGLNESRIGITSLRLGELGHDDCIRFRQIRTDVVDNQIDTIGKAFQGLTIACARCHDHKLDPIPTADYYAMYSVLTSSRMVTRTVDTPDLYRGIKQRLSAAKPAIRSELAAQWMKETADMRRYLMAANRAAKGLATVPRDLEELSLDRIAAWVKALDKPKQEMEWPLQPFVRMAAGASPQSIIGEYAEESRKRKEFNQRNFQPFGVLEGWPSEGNAAPLAVTRPGEFAIAASGGKAVTGIYPSGLFTHTVSERLNAAVRSPIVPKDKKFISLLVMGGKLGSRRTILDNCMLSEDYQTMEQPSLSWIRIPNRDDQRGLPFYLELVTKADNPRIPDRPDRLKATAEVMAAPNSYFGIARAVLHDVDPSPKDELGLANKLLGGGAFDGVEALAGRFGAFTQEALTRWGANQATEEDAHWLGWLVEHGLLSNSKEQSTTLSERIGDYRELESRIHEARVIQGVADLESGYDFPVLVGGDAARPGKLAQRGFLRLISGTGEGFAVSGSGRLEMADLIASPRNPLTARVMVNRVWQHVFGRGIVATSDNFGTYGEQPTHPELLDWLAARFVSDGWSMKKQIRLLVLSQTFRQESTTTEKASQDDPLNRLLSHYPLRRLEGESIRDSILLVSGRLDRTLYGPSIQPHREEPKDYRKLHQGPLDGNGRRSIYIKVTRHEGSQFLETFDFPNPNLARGNRDTTNVPGQALTLLNDPFVVEQAGAWAARMLEQSSASAGDRIDAMFREALGRGPEPQERERMEGMVRELASLRKVEAGKMLTSRDVWKDVAHAIFNLKEFLYVR